MIANVLWLVALFAGAGVIAWGADQFVEHLGPAAGRLRVSSFALALLLAGAEPEELVTAVTAAVRGSPGIALGDVIGANVTICLVALGLGAVVAPLPFSRRVMLYAMSGLPLGIISVLLVWNGRVDRVEGTFLILCYVAFVAIIWILERRPPALGEIGEINHSDEGQGKSPHALVWVLLGVASMVIGATLVVEAVRRIAHVEAAQTQVGLTIVGFATGFELVVLAWRAAKRGAPDAAVAAVVGSFSYNVTMTLGTAALARPLLLKDTSAVHLPLVAMIVSLAVVVVLATRRRQLSRIEGILLLCLYPAFVILVFHRF
jgi:cation:H+ antiporter